MNCFNNGGNPFNQDSMLDAIAVLSFIISLQNLYENRQQSADNDVQKENDKQAHYLLDELNKRFEEQNEMIRMIQEDLQEVKNYIELSSNS